jgi:hypothetical protein
MTLALFWTQVYYLLIVETRANDPLAHHYSTQNQHPLKNKYKDTKNLNLKGEFFEMFYLFFLMILFEPVEDELR